MKKLIVIFLALVVLAGCNVAVPEEEVVIVENPLDCDGHYMMVFEPFQMKDWANCDFFAPAGIYWQNDVDGRLFFLGEIGDTEIETDCCEDGTGNIIPDPIALFGKCPSGFEWELIVPEPEIE